MRSGEKLIFIDYLKSFSMLYIVGYWHLFDYTGFFPASLYPISEKLSIVTLGLFTFISGFLSAKSIIKSPKIIHFYVKRVARIYPLYVVAAVLFLIYGLQDSLTAWKSVFLVSMVYGPAPRTLWFITMIMLFYLTAPFLVRFADHLKKYLAFSLSVMILVMSLMVILRTIDIRLLLYFPCFSIGIYCAIHGMKNNLINARYAAILLVIGLISYLIPTDWWTIEKLKQVPFILSSSYLIFYLSYKKQELFANSRFIEFLSYSSYGMYLFHRPLYEKLKAFYFPKDGLLQVLYLIGICLLVIALTSWLLQKVNDRLYAVVGDWLKKKPFLHRRQI